MCFQHWLHFIQPTVMGTLQVMMPTRLMKCRTGFAVLVLLALGLGCKSGGDQSDVAAVPVCPTGDVCCGRLPAACPTGYRCTASGTCENPARVWIPQSPFWMGCNSATDSACESDESPYHRVNVPAFSLDRLEVTRAQYAECVKAGACTAPQGQGAPIPQPSSPVTMIDWYQAKAYCTYRGGRLPSEAEWEKAARGGCEQFGASCKEETPIYPWGNEPVTCAQVAVAGNCEAPIGPGGAYPNGRSPYGALDMAGSVWEWVEDCSHPSYAGAPNDGSAWIKPCESDVRIDRGGRNGDMKNTLRASNRSDEHAKNPIETVGVRCAYDG